MFLYLHLVVGSMRKFHLKLKETSQNYEVEEREMTVDFENAVMTDMNQR